MNKSSGSSGSLPIENKSRICFFGGEKGGIGKTTLATVFAYLFLESKREIAGATLDPSNPAFKRQLSEILPASSVGSFTLTLAKDVNNFGLFLSKNISKTVLIDSPSSFYYTFSNHLLDFALASGRLDFIWIVSEESNSSKQLFAYREILEGHPNLNYLIFFPDWIHGGEFDSNFRGLPCYRLPTLSPFIFSKLKEGLQFLKFKELADPYLKGVINSYLIRFRNQLGQDLDSFLMG